MKIMKILIVAVPIVAMAQSAVNWRNTHTHTLSRWIARIHSTYTLTSTQLQPLCAKRHISLLQILESNSCFEGVYRIVIPTL